VVTQIAAGSVTTLSTGKEMFLQGLKTAYLWLAVLNAFAVIPSVLRGQNRIKEPYQNVAATIE